MLGQMAGLGAGAGMGAGIGMMLLHLDAAIAGEESRAIIFPDAPY